MGLNCLNYGVSSELSELWSELKSSSYRSWCSELSELSPSVPIAAATLHHMHTAAHNQLERALEAVLAAHLLTNFQT